MYTGAQMNKSRLSHTRCDNTKMECQINHGRTAVHNTKLSSQVFSAEKQHNLSTRPYITTRPSHCRPGTTLSHCSTADAVSIIIHNQNGGHIGMVYIVQHTKHVTLPANTLQQLFSTNKVKPTDRQRHTRVSWVYAQQKLGQLPHWDILRTVHIPGGITIIARVLHTTLHCVV